MVKNVLQFPEEYYVGKQIDPKRFINSRTVTPGRKRLLEERVTDLEILYDLKFQDESEIIVILVGIDKKVDDWTDDNVAFSVAASFPYQSMVIVHNGFGAHIYTFDAKEQKRNAGRMSIDKVHKSLGFDMRRPDEENAFLISKFGEAVRKCDSAISVCKEWNQIINEYWKLHKSIKQYEQMGLVEFPDGTVAIDINKLLENEAEDEERYNSVGSWLDRRQEEREKFYEDGLYSFGNDWITYGSQIDDFELTDDCADKYWWWNKDDD